MVTCVLNSVMKMPVRHLNRDIQKAGDNVGLELRKQSKFET